MKKLLIYLIPVLAFCLLNITSCKDEAEERPPVQTFLHSLLLFAEGNSDYPCLENIRKLTSYAVELSRDQNFLVGTRCNADRKQR